eukprot:gb/GFBE01027237.1/.p1 GENE.gb/GFBE01027237.1/~~gb/GFBE01027237.1/.p1  ORF type:complete len:468 (+),score=113.58 gb/GFBE01027237.1/:1-1404(+)
MDESLDSQAAATAAGAAAERLRQDKAELIAANERLKREIEELHERLSFVEEIVGPTESQRKKFQTQLISAREASLRVAHGCGGSVPTRCVGRLDESWLRMKGLSDQECSMLQRGCISGENGVPCDISLLGDPAFCPYDRETLQPKWEAKGGFLKLSLGDIRDKWGEEVAMEIVRCAMELDRHDASRRLGVELPWHEKENREMEVAEVIALLGQQLLAAKCSGGGRSGLAEEDEDSEWGGLPRSEVPSPEDVGEGASRAWSMLEAMMSDLGLNPRSATTPSLISGSERYERLMMQSHCPERDRAEEDDTDDEVVQEALEEDMQRQAAAEQDIQQMLHEPSTVNIPQQLATPQSASQQKASASRTMLTPSGAQTPLTGTPGTANRGSRALSSSGTRATSSSPDSAEAVSAPEAGDTHVELALPHEVSANETLFLQLLEDEVAGNLSLYLPGSPDTFRIESPSSSGQLTQ